jgi:hypothetical protein
MSEEKSSQERVENAHLLKGFTMVNIGTDNLVIIEGEKDGSSIDILIPYKFMSEAVEIMRLEIQKQVNSNVKEISDSEG